MPGAVRGRRSTNRSRPWRDIPGGRTARPRAAPTRSASGSVRLREVMHLAELRFRTGDQTLDQLEEQHRARLVDFEKFRGVDGHTDQHHAWIVGSAVERVATIVGEPNLPVRLIQLANLVAVPRDDGRARNRNPLP